MSKKIYISADIEGVTGVVHFDETMRSKSDDFSVYRKLMTTEVNAAIEGALAAGATDIVVRDAHGDARNILPGELHKKARLIRGWADTPYCMMEGIDRGFDGVIFVGYHAAADTPNATLKHTMTFRIAEVTINGILLAEAGLNALIAGIYDVPVLMLAGDDAACNYAASTFPDIQTVAVKEGMGAAAISVHPEVACEEIRKTAEKAVSDIASIKPFKPQKPYQFKVRYRSEHSAFKAAFYPGVERMDNTTVVYRSDSLKACFQFFYFCQG